MKKIRVALLALALAVLALPPLFGMLAEARVAAHAESMRAGGLTVGIETYDRGWFTSRAVLTLAAGPQAEPAGAAALLLGEPMRVEMDLNHGPVSLQDGLFLGFAQMRAQPAPAPPLAVRPGSPSATPPGAIEAQSTFGGALHFLARLPSLERQTASAELSLAGAVITGTLARSRSSVRASADTLRYRQGSEALFVQGLSAHADHERAPHDLAPGTLELRLDRAEVNIGRGPRVEPLLDARGVTLESRVTLDPDGERLDGELRVGLEGMRLADGTEVTNAFVAAAARGIPPAAIAAYQQARAASSTAEPAIARLLEAGPRLSIDPLRFNMDGATLDATLLLEAVPQRLPAGGPLDLGDARLWSTLLDGRLEIVAAKPLAERLAVEIAKAQLRSRRAPGEPISLESLDTMARVQVGFALALLSAQGILEDTDGVYRTRVLLEDGQLSVNGAAPLRGVP